MNIYDKIISNYILIIFILEKNNNSEQINFTLDNKLTKDEINQIKEYAKKQETLDIILDTQNNIKDFINTEYRWANENYLKKSGKSVIDLQIALNKQPGINLVPDGLFGKNTLKALIAFQKDKGLDVDGLAGKNTNKELFGEEIVTNNDKKNIISNKIPNSNKEIKSNKDYYKVLVGEFAEKYNVPKKYIIKLINHENYQWDPYIKAKGDKNTAYGLGQMTDATWKRFGYGLDRYNAKGQIEATIRYMKYIQNIKQCSWEEVLAYYNTGESIMNITNSKAKKFYDNNNPIAKKIPISRNKITPEIYYIGAIAYYNDITYGEAIKYYNKNLQT